MSDVFKLDSNFLARFNIAPLSRSVSSISTRDSLNTRIDNTTTSSPNLAFHTVFAVNEDILGELGHCFHV